MQIVLAYQENRKIIDATCGHLEIEINNCFINDCRIAYGFGIILHM